MSVKTIDATTLKSWIDLGEVVVVDVREPSEYNAENIPGSKLIPLARICKKSLPDCTGKRLVLHCKAGKRGGTACEKLLSEDPGLEIYNLEGGMSAWKAAGNKVNSSGKFFLPLDRQVQLVIGLCVLTGSILGYFINPAFFVLSGFFGLGLTFSGITGYCGLAMIIARMPWNQGINTKTMCMTKRD